ncbi:MAG TPA: hypothetical protein VGQ59_01130 [Cyclobacteriaceae bacterium]|jgi:chromosome segregation ATPase|nr:hypothetical protein [Cyclobacteriaceae bacterium]
MNVDINIDEIRNQFDELRRTIRSLQERKNVQLKEYQVSKKEFEKLNSELSWTEKYLGGNFGGDKEKLSMTRSLREKISKLRIELRKIDRNLSTESEKIKNEVIEHLSKNSYRFRKLTSENEQNQQLIIEISSFLNILKKAKNGIKDALLFTSWKGLLEHPRAQNELSRFNQVLVNFQFKINEYEVQTGTQLLNGKKLEDFIQFSTEKIAMESFYKLNRSINEISEKINGMNSEIEKEISVLTEKTYQSVLK